MTPERSLRLFHVHFAGGQVAWIERLPVGTPPPPVTPPDQLCWAVDGIFVVDLFQSGNVYPDYPVYESPDGVAVGRIMRK